MPDQHLHQETLTNNKYLLMISNTNSTQVRFQKFNNKLVDIISQWNDTLWHHAPLPPLLTLPWFNRSHPPLVLPAVVASGSEVTGVRGQVGSGSAVAEAVGVTAGPVGFSSGKEKASPAGRPAHTDPQAPDSESVIVAMERVSVLFDRYADQVHTHHAFKKNILKFTQVL